MTPRLRDKTSYHLFEITHPRDQIVITSPLESRQVAAGGRVEEAEDGLAAALVAEEPRVHLLLAHLHDVVEAVEVEGLDGEGGVYMKSTQFLDPIPPCLSALRGSAKKLWPGCVNTAGKLRQK